MKEPSEFLLDYAAGLQEPENLFSGHRLPPDFALPDNLLVFFHDYTAPAPNAHGRHTLVIPLDEMTYYMGREECALHPGTLLYVPPRVMRFMHPNSPGYRRLFITFELNRAQGYLPRQGIFRMDGEIFRKLRHFLECYQAGTEESEAAALMELLAALRRSGEPDSAGFILPRAIERTLEMLDGRLAEVYEIKIIANEIGLSESHLRSLFRRHVGISLGRFIMGKKLDLAKYYLVNSDKSVAEIAGLCGFANIFVFSTFFKRHAGIPPLRCRKAGIRGRGIAPSRPPKERAGL